MALLRHVGQWDRMHYFNKVTFVARSNYFKIVVLVLVLLYAYNFFLDEDFVFNNSLKDKFDELKFSKPKTKNQIIMIEKPAGNNTCYDWEYKPADYTLIYKPTKKHQNTPCSYPKNETVKKIVTHDKKVIWKGCTNKTRSCHEIPYFDKKRNIRRNVPPCCLKHLLEMLGHLDEEFTKHNITYYVTDGALLGWYRNRQLVPYDLDIDIHVDGAFFKTKIWFEIFKTLNQKYGYNYWAVKNYKVKVKYSKYNGLNIDIWPYYNIKLRKHYGQIKPGEWLSFNFGPGTSVRTSDMLPPRRTTISGVPCYVPNKALTYLIAQYGKEPKIWLQEINCKTLNEDYKCLS